MNTAFTVFKRALLDIHHGYITLGRLYAWQALNAGQIRDKLTLLSLCYRHIDASRQVIDFIKNSYAYNELYVGWANDIMPDQPIKTTIQHHINLITAALQNKIQSTHRLAKNTIALQPLAYFLSQTDILYPEIDTDLELEDILGKQPSALYHPMKRLSGPTHVPIDRAFAPRYSILDTKAPLYADNITDAAPYYWCLSLRECLAADMCALNLIEYDGLPVDFYVDMAKQAYDEIRHAAIFFDISIHLLPDLKRSLTHTDVLFREIELYEMTGCGLPVPLERHLYEAMWNATLVERFILMHLDTETAGIRRLRQKMRSPFSLKYPYIAHQLDIVTREEISHAKLGSKWIKYLIPNQTTRLNTIKETRLLRGIFLLTASSHHCNMPLTTLVKHCITHTHHHESA